MTLQDALVAYRTYARAEGKSPRTVEYYEENLKRFLWYADVKGWPDDARQLTEWHIREFLGYVTSETHRWGIGGNGAESSRRQASHSTVHHYFSILRAFFNWCVKEGFLQETPVAKVTSAV